MFKLSTHNSNFPVRKNVGLISDNKSLLKVVEKI